MTGGGIYNAMYTGRLAAEVAFKCIESGDLSKEALMEYDSVWRDSKMGRALERNYQMKEIFVKLTDKQLDAILTSVKNLKMADFSTLSLVKEIVKLNPKLIKDLTGLKKYFE
jgi:digeranylgeranylglycerophospholipid reductase